MIRKRLMTEINLASFKFQESYHYIQYSEDLKSILTTSLEQKFGGAYISHKAAVIIQQSYRKYRLRKNLNSSIRCDTKAVRLRNNSMPENLHNFENDSDCDLTEGEDNYTVTNNFTLGNLKLSKIKDSLSHLLPELQKSPKMNSSHSESSITEIEIQIGDKISYEECSVKVGDMLSTKCDEDLENFQNDSNKTDSTEESDSSSVDRMPLLLQDSSSLDKLPPPMPVISTNLLASRSEKLKSKTKLFSFENPACENEENKTESKNNLVKNPPISRVNLVNIQPGRSPRDSGVSSHSSNTDLLTFDYPDINRAHQNPCLYNQRPLSIISCNSAKTGAAIQSNSTTHKEKNTILETELTTDNYIPPIFEDNDSLFDNSMPQIPSIMTSSKDSGVDADSGIALSNQQNVLNRIPFQDKPVYWRLLHRHNCLMGCVSQNLLSSSSTQKTSAEKSTGSASLWLKSSSEKSDSVDITDSTNIKILDLSTKEFVNRVLYRVAVNLFNSENFYCHHFVSSLNGKMPIKISSNEIYNESERKNSSVGLKFMEDHKIFNVRCPIEMASFLRNREVNLQVIADFISSQNSVFHLNVLKCYLKNLPLENLNFLEAFDVFIRTFKIPDDSTKIDYLILQFCQYYIKHFQKSPEIDSGSLMSLGRIIILLRSTVDRSKSLSFSNSILSFGDFIKHIQNCFKSQHMPYSMEILQKIYIGITRSNPDANDLANKLINRIENIKEPKTKSSPSPNRTINPSFYSGNFLQTYRRLTYCCDVQQSDNLNKKLKKHEHLRSLFIFNDSLIIAKRSTRSSSKPSKYFRIDSKFQCRSIINLLNHRIEKVFGAVNPHQISIKCFDESANPASNFSRPLIYFICDSESSCEKLLSKVTLSQLESQCVEQLRLHQWDCNHSTKQCLCLTVIHATSRLIIKNSQKYFQSLC